MARQDLGNPINDGLDVRLIHRPLRRLLNRRLASIGVRVLFDPEFVVLDPRTMRFGAWETDGKTTADTTDFNRGWNETLIEE